MNPDPMTIPLTTAERLVFLRLVLAELTDRLTITSEYRTAAQRNKARQSYHQRRPDA